jgi:hypothetical protein
VETVDDVWYADESAYNEAEPEPYVTFSGKVLTRADIEKLADEAELGYDVTHLKER